MGRTHRDTAADACAMSAEEAAYWLSLPDDLRDEQRNSLWCARNRDRRARERAERDELCRAAGVKHSDGYRVVHQKLEAYRAAQEAASSEAWRERYAHRQGRRHSGCDTRRRRADGKRLGGHHGHGYYERMSESPRAAEHRIGEYARSCYARGLDEAHVARHVQGGCGDWDNRRLRVSY
jgi:hypothetical protein